MVFLIKRDSDLCPRCHENKPLLYRVRSDLLDEPACEECARDAAKLGLWVEKIDDKGPRINRAH